MQATVMNSALKNEPFSILLSPFTHWFLNTEIFLYLSFFSQHTHKYTDHNTVFILFEDSLCPQNECLGMVNAGILKLLITKKKKLFKILKQ